ncbi:MAG: homoserine kinase [Candidatus Omnitrophica bacterium]|nr:homoserine kinase [Candidatus Omnitrophota bacterium]
MNRIKITVPASSGNIGSGFDTLGIAVSLRNYFEMEASETETQLEVIGGGGASLQPMCLEMVKAAARWFFQRSGLASRHFTFRVDNKIPIARGLASSATFRLAVLEGLNRMLNVKRSDSDIVKWAAELEGCSDNVVPCYYGGFCASGIVGDQLVHYEFPIPPVIDFVAVSPAKEVETDKARTVFTPAMPREDAIFTHTRGILLTAAFAQSDYEQIGDLLEDRFHQPQRQAAIPALAPLFDVIRAARDAGAIGAYLSGSGSTIMALTLEKKEAVGDAMSQVIAQYGMQSEIRYLKADNKGLTAKSF